MTADPLRRFRRKQVPMKRAGQPAELAIGVVMLADPSVELRLGRDHCRHRRQTVPIKARSINLEQLQELLRIRRCSALLVIIKVDVGVELIALPAPDAPCPEA